MIYKKIDKKFFENHEKNSEIMKIKNINDLLNL